MTEPYHDEELKRWIAKARDAIAKLTPEQYALLVEEQRKSFVRGMTTKCEHGVTDFEQCPDCRGRN